MPDLAALGSRYRRLMTGAARTVNDRFSETELNEHTNCHYRWFYSVGGSKTDLLFSTIDSTSRASCRPS